MRTRPQATAPQGGAGGYSLILIYTLKDRDHPMGGGGGGGARRGVTIHTYTYICICINKPSTDAAGLAQMFNSGLQRV